MVVIPQDLVEKVLELMPKIVAGDDKIKEEVLAGSSVAQSFKRHRS